MTNDDKKKIIAEGELLEGLTKHPGWQLLAQKIKDKTDAISRSQSGIPITDAAMSSYRQGQWAGLTKAVSIVEDSIKQMQELTQE